MISPPSYFSFCDHNPNVNFTKSEMVVRLQKLASYAPAESLPDTTAARQGRCAGVDNNDIAMMIMVVVVVVMKTMMMIVLNEKKTTRRSRKRMVVVVEGDDDGSRG